MDAVAQATMMKRASSNSSFVASGTPSTLSAQRVTLRAGSRTLLDQFTHTFYPGELWCIAGPNGAGKTTLISALTGLVQPAEGHVEIDGARLADWAPASLARRRAWMPQSAHDAFSASVLDIVMLGRHPHLTGWGWERPEDRAAAHDALAMLDLSGFASRDVLSLSGGERQRVALAATLCQDAPLMLLDEPLAHLDLRHQIDCLEVLTAWAAEPARTVVFSCHDLNLARRFATHALLMDGGGRAFAGPVRDVLTPELASRAFGYPLMLLQDDGYEALVPVSRSRAYTARQDGH